MRRRRLVCLTAAALVLFAAGTGQAAPPQEPRVQTTRAAEPRAERGGGLPFSGLDAALFIAGAGPLLLLGAGLSRRRPKATVQPGSEEHLTLA